MLLRNFTKIHLFDVMDGGGYSLSLIDLPEVELGRFKCHLCDKIYRDPIQCTCGHRYCKMCYISYCRRVRVQL